MKPLTLITILLSISSSHQANFRPQHIDFRTWNVNPEEEPEARVPVVEDSKKDENGSVTTFWTVTSKVGPKDETSDWKPVSVSVSVSHTKNNSSEAPEFYTTENDSLNTSLSDETFTSMTEELDEDISEVNLTSNLTESANMPMEIDEDLDESILNVTYVNETISSAGEVVDINEEEKPIRNDKALKTENFTSNIENIHSTAVSSPRNESKIDDEMVDVAGNETESNQNFVYNSEFSRNAESSSLQNAENITFQGDGNWNESSGLVNELLVATGIQWQSNDKKSNTSKIVTMDENVQLSTDLGGGNDSNIDFSEADVIDHPNEDIEMIYVTTEIDPNIQEDGEEDLPSSTESSFSDYNISDEVSNQDFSKTIQNESILANSSIIDERYNISSSIGSNFGHDDDFEPGMSKSTSQENNYTTESLVFTEGTFDVDNSSSKLDDSSAPTFSTMEVPKEDEELVPVFSIQRFIQSEYNIDKLFDLEPAGHGDITTSTDSSKVTDELVSEDGGKASNETIGVDDKTSSNETSSNSASDGKRSFDLNNTKIDIDESLNDIFSEISEDEEIFTTEAQKIKEKNLGSMEHSNTQTMGYGEPSTEQTTQYEDLGLMVHNNTETTTKIMGYDEPLNESTTQGEEFIKNHTSVANKSKIEDLGLMVHDNNETTTKIMGYGEPSNESKIQDEELIKNNIAFDNKSKIEEEPVLNDGNIVTLLKNLRLSVLMDLLKRTKLDREFAKINQSLTIFAPTDEAFNSLSPKTIRKFQHNPELLRKMLLHHVTDSIIFSKDFKNEKRILSYATNRVKGQKYDSHFTELDPSSRVPLTLNLFPRKGATVDGARFILADIRGINGVIHVVNKVLYRLATADVFSTVQKCSRFSIFTQLVEKSGINLRDAPFTLFVPVNEAWESDILAKNLTEQQAKDIVRSHVAEGSRFSTTLADNEEIDTLHTYWNLKVAVRNGELKEIQRARVIMPDIPSTNGVVHVIDRTLHETKFCEDLF